jgi:tubulin polyglutamylase TTLL4
VDECTGEAWNILWANCSDKSHIFQNLNEFQRVNHFPSSYEITRKNRLWFNYLKARTKHGSKDYSFIPETYILPQELDQLIAHHTLL